MDKIVHDVRRNQWLSIVSACQKRPEGMTIKQWLAENGVKEKAYYYWQRKFRTEICAKFAENKKELPSVNSTEFVEIPMPNPASDASSTFAFSPDAVISLSGCLIAFSNNTSEHLVNSIMEGIKYAR
jgi:putative transposase